MRTTAVAVLLCLVLLAAAAQPGDKPTPEELATFFDEAVPALMEEHHVVGAVVGVADSSAVLFLRGYGSADLQRGVPVDPERTLFRVGSISKLLTWTAIMQLEEQGRLRLDDPVEDYLDFELSDNFDEPVRIIDLMNHTPGFEDRMIDLMVLESRYQKTLKQAVSRNIPRRVRPPGQEVAYSNYGTMLAGYVVERVVETPFEEYVERNIFQPLGMRRSTFLQPLPSDLAEHLATAYVHQAGKLIPQKFEIVNGAPAGALSSTAPDMLRFYQAYLNGGGAAGRRILREETVSRMREPTFRHDPRTNGFAHGFFEVGQGETKGFGHGGDTIFFHSDSGYLPAEDLAYFVSTNTATGMRLTLKLRELMMARFFPAPSGSELAARARLEPELREYTGAFAMNRRAEADPTQIMGGLTVVNPKLAEDGRGLRIASILDPEGGIYVPVDHDIFQRADGNIRIVFLRDDRGRVRSLYAHDFPAFLFTRPPLVEHPAVSLTVLVLGVLFLLTSLVAPPTGLLTLFPRLRSRGGGGIRSLALWSGRAYLLLVVLEVILIQSLGNFIFVPIGPIHVIPLYLAAAAAAVMLWSVVPAWRRRLFRPLGRLHYTALAFSQALFVAWLGYWGFFFV